ncbi:MAG: 1,2-phenylacetyl-CoA epoxidase subunit PaaC [Acidimicrobiia bacterium]
MIEMSPAGQAYLLAFADDEHMIGSRHANWIGLGPFLEEDLAFCSIAQDELGHALALYEMFIPSNEIDRFALLREPTEYRSAALAEIECPTWDLALVRHWLYDTAEQLRWQALSQSVVPEVGALATQALRDEAFHTEHAAMFLTRISGDDKATVRVEAAIERLLPLSASVWAAPDHENDAVGQGFVSHHSSELLDRWRQSIAEQADRFGLHADFAAVSQPTSRQQRIDGFDTFHSSLGEVISLDPTAIW